MGKAFVATLVMLVGAAVPVATVGAASAAEVADQSAINHGTFGGLVDASDTGRSAARLAPASPDQGSTLPGQSRLVGQANPAMSAAVDRLARQLGDDPGRIYNWVRGKVAFEPGWGSMLGADGCLQTLTCNAHDTTSLLVALLEAADYEARFVTGTVDVDARLFRSAVGDMDTVAAASQAAGATGWAHQLLAGGTKVRIPHIWAEAKLGRSAKYTPLDAALKPHTFTPPASPPFDVARLSSQMTGSVSYDAGAASVSEFDAASFDAALKAANDAMFRPLEQLAPGTRTFFTKLQRITGDLAPAVGSVKVVDAAASKTGVVATAPPGRVVVVASRAETLSDDVRHRVRVGFPGTGGVPTSDVFLDLLAGNRLTVDFGAADAAASAAAAAAGGAWAVAPRSILERPVLLLGGTPMLTGAPIPFTDFQAVQVQVLRPDGLVSSSAETFLRAGGVGALVVDPVRTNAGTLDVVGQRVRALAQRLRTNPPPSMTFDQLHGEILLSHGLAYFAMLDMATELAAHRLDIREIAAVPGIAMVSWQPVPRAGSVPAGSLQIDVQQSGIAGAVARNGDPTRAALHRKVTGAFGSGMEHGIFESMLGLRATSTVDLLRRALDTGVPIGVVLDDASLATVFAQLNAPPNVRDFITGSLAIGFDSYIPLEPATIDDWTGTGWMQLRDDGAFGYLLAGAISGGAVTQSASQETQTMYDMSVDAGLGALGQSSNLTVARGAGVATTLLAPIGAGMETYETIKEVQADGGSTLEAVGAGIAAGTVKGAIGIATGIATAEAMVFGGPAAATAVAIGGAELADQAATAVRNTVVDNLP